MDIKNYRGVWVLAEQRDGTLQKVSLELLGKGSELAQKLGTNLTAVLLGYEIDNIAKELIQYGADKVLYLEHPLLKNYNTDGYTKVICDLVDKEKPEIILVGATYIGRDLGPRVSARLATGLTADCTGLDVDGETNNLLMTRPAFGGNLMATIECSNHRPQMSTVRPGVFEKLPKNDDRHGNIEKIIENLKECDIRTKVLEVIKTVKDIKDISEANILVAGGRGIGCAEGFEVLKELSQALDASIAGSRAAIEAGWVDKACQVGQTGKTVRPNVYIACGISGAIQHLAGMQDSDYIIAINKDESCPMIKMADLAIVGDYRKVIPEIVEQLKKEG